MKYAEIDAVKNLHIANNRGKTLQIWISLHSTRTFKPYKSYIPSRFVEL